MVAIACAATSFSATVNSTFIGVPPNDTSYSDPHNWSPAVVPNNSSSTNYNVTISSKYVVVDRDATVSNLSLSGTTNLSIAGRTLTVTGTTIDSILPQPPDASVGFLSGIYVFSTSKAIILPPHEATFNAGHLSSFFNGTLAGIYSIFGSQGKTATLQFVGADIIRNAGSLTLGGGLARVVDENGTDALRNFQVNLHGATFSISDQSFSTGGNFTNNGLLSVRDFDADAALNVTGNLTNFDAVSKTLSDGDYEIGSAGFENTHTSTFRFTGADIVHNSASITLIAGGFIKDESGNDGLRNFSDNTAAGTFTLIDEQTFTAASDFTNAGTVQIFAGEVSNTRFIMAGSHQYVQSAGQTNLRPGFFTGDMQINGGLLSGGVGFVGATSSIHGNVTIGNATLKPQGLFISGKLTLSAASHLRIKINSPNDFVNVQSAALAGALDIEVDPQFVPASDDTFPILFADTISGSFANAPNGARVATVDGRASFTVNYSAGSDSVFLSGYETIPPAAQLLNISGRGEILNGERVLIGGFVIGGVEPKKVIVRGIGPSLAHYAIADALQDPFLELHNSLGVLFASNDNWRDNQEAQIEATMIPPTDNREAAIVATLNPGAYTAVLRGSNNATGTALLEIFDLAAQSHSKIINLSARGFVDATNVLIAGMIAGEKPGNTDLVLRALGPDLASAGIQNPLPDPTLDLRDANGMSLAFNDDQYVNPPGGSTFPIFGGESLNDSIMRVSLPPGRYTAIVRSKTGEGGVALVETYDLHR
jgi:hypothetical protein